MSRELQVLINLAADLRNLADNMQRVNPSYASSLLERADMHERKALELPAEGRA
jgi:hypothetical protein